jgi:hypothetical protein
MLGQDQAVKQLTLWLARPASKAFLFSGPTGVGKTTAAHAIARELGCDPYWGVHVIKSGEQDAAAVSETLKALRYVGLGSGWKVAIVDEADWMSSKASQLWLSALEDLPARSVVIFTTNHIGRILAGAGQRFVDRCEVVNFASTPEQLPDFDALVSRIWRGEGMPGEPPTASELGNLRDLSGLYSFRRVVQQAEVWMRYAAAGAEPPKSPPAPVLDPSGRHSGGPSPRAGKVPACDVADGLREKRREAARKAVATRRRNQGLS